MHGKLACTDLQGTMWIRIKKHLKVSMQGHACQKVAVFQQVIGLHALNDVPQLIAIHHGPLPQRVSCMSTFSADSVSGDSVLCSHVLDCTPSD